MAAAQTDWRELIRAFLQTEKALAGIPAWQAEPNGRVMRWARPVAVKGELTGFVLTARAYPNEQELKFRLILSQERAIWRLDFCRTDSHINSHNRPIDLQESFITGPHYHAWADNERFASANSLPKRLPNARTLQPNVRTFENAFRWFCGQTTIGIVSADIPELPKRTTLL